MGAVTGDNRSRHELGRFLRSRRERVKPEDVGFPVGPRRRATGLRREEVAVLAGLSPTWYTYLEQGRDIHPSPQVLDSLARVLRLTEDERRYVHTLIYGQVIEPQPLDAEVSADEVMRQITATAELSPYPLFTGNVYGDLISWNHAATEWYDDWGRLPPEERNVMRWLFTSPVAKERFVDWEEEMLDNVARWRAEAAKRPTDARMQQIIAELYEVSPEFARWWDDQHVREQRVRLRRLRHPRRGVQALRVVLLRAPEFPEVAAVFHVPVRTQDPRSG
jgi:transcriptional regulator with XRE-family HTH domain